MDFISCSRQTKHNSDFKRQ